MTPSRHMRGSSKWRIKTKATKWAASRADVRTKILDSSSRIPAAAKAVGNKAVSRIVTPASKISRMSSVGSKVAVSRSDAMIKAVVSSADPTPTQKGAAQLGWPFSLALEQ